LEQLELEAQREKDVENALKHVKAMAAAASEDIDESTTTDNSAAKMKSLHKFKGAVKSIRKIQSTTYNIKSLVENKRLARAQQRAREERLMLEENMTAAAASGKNRADDDGVDLEKFDCVLESEARVLELFKELAEERDEDEPDMDEDSGLMDKTLDLREESYVMKLSKAKLEVSE
jgi:hypothetical protein